MSRKKELVFKIMKLKFSKDELAIKYKEENTILKEKVLLLTFELKGIKRNKELIKGVLVSDKLFARFDRIDHNHRFAKDGHVIKESERVTFLSRYKNIDDLKELTRTNFQWQMNGNEDELTELRLVIKEYGAKP